MLFNAFGPSISRPQFRRVGASTLAKPLSLASLAEAWNDLTVFLKLKFTWSKPVCVGQESSEFGGGGSWPFWLQDTPSIIGSFGSVSSGHALEHPAFGY